MAHPTWFGWQDTYTYFGLKAGPRMIIFTRDHDKQQVTVSGKAIRDFVMAGKSNGTEYRFTLTTADHAVPAFSTQSIWNQQTGKKQESTGQFTIKANHGLRIEYRTSGGLKGQATFTMFTDSTEWSKKPHWYTEKLQHVTVTGSFDASTAQPVAVPVAQPVTVESLDKAAVERVTAAKAAHKASKTRRAVKAAIIPAAVKAARPAMPVPAVRAQDIHFSINLDCYIRRPAIGALPVDKLPVGWEFTASNKETAVYNGKKYSPITVTSGKLAGEQGLVDTVYTLDYLASLKAAGDHHGALLITVDTSKLTIGQRGAVLTSFTTYARAWYGLNGQSGQPARKLKVTDKSITFGLNSTLEVDTVISAIYLVTALVSKATAHQPAAQPTISTATEAARLFVESHLIPKQYRIIPSDGPSSDITDISRAMYRQARQSAA